MGAVGARRREDLTGTDAGPYCIGTDNDTGMDAAMDPTPFALLHSRATVLQTANSARPWAPVVPDREPRSARRDRHRLALARVLRRIAEAVAPAPAPAPDRDAASHRPAWDPCGPATRRDTLSPAR